MSSVLDHKMFQMARETSWMSTCIRRQVGAVLRSPSGLYSTGWNEERNSRLCATDCPRAKSEEPPGAPFAGNGKCIATHAEMKAIAHMQQLYGYETFAGFVIWVTHKPCSDCANRLDQMQISVKWEKEYP
jgi:deoxycytidylate deaminase